MFKKPLKKAFRKKPSGEDSEEESVAKSPVPAEKEKKVPVIELEDDEDESETFFVRPLRKVQSDLTSSSGLTAKLSFDDDSGDTEEFRIKKSNRSRRIAKQLKEEWTEDTGRAEAGLKDLRIGVRPATEIPAQSHHSTSESRIIMNDEELEELGTEYRRPTVAGGQIPNQKLIAEAKKRREEARKALDGEYIALDDTERFVDSKSRLIREDDNDLSDEDAEIVMSSASGQLATSKEKEAENRRRNREMFERDEMIGGNSVAFQIFVSGSEDYSTKNESAGFADAHVLSYGLPESTFAGSVLEGSDEETQRWEEAQLRKGVTLPQIQALSDEISKPVRPMSDYVEPQYAAMWAEQPHQSAVATVDEIRKKIRNRMEIARDSQRRHLNELEKVSGDMNDCRDAITKLELELQSASFEYKFYQEMRGFVWDVIDCFNDKLGLITIIEEKTLGVLRRGAVAARELRQQYIKDLAEEIHGKNSVDLLLNMKEAHERRIRLGEYNERRRRMAAVAKTSEDEFDLDEFESPASAQPPAYLEALASATSLFDDTVENFRSLPVLLSKFRDWRSSCSQSYNDAYIAHCFPKLTTSSLVDMPWIKDIIANAFAPNSDGEISSDDSDLRVIPMIIEDVVFARLTALVDVWDPMSTIQCSRITAFIKETLSDFPLIAINRKPVQEFLRAVGERLIKAIEDDVFLPVYSQRVLDSDPEARMFVSQQFAAGLKLFSNILLFHGILSNAALVELTIEKLLNRCLLVPLRTSHNRSESVARCEAIFVRIPEDRLTLAPSPTVPKHFEMFCHVVLNLGKQNPNRDEVTALSRLLMKLKDFKGAETLETQLRR